MALRCFLYVKTRLTGYSNEHGTTSRWNTCHLGRQHPNRLVLLSSRTYSTHHIYQNDSYRRVMKVNLVLNQLWWHMIHMMIYLIQRNSISLQRLLHLKTAIFPSINQAVPCWFNMNNHSCSTNTTPYPANMRAALVSLNKGQLPISSYVSSQPWSKAHQIHQSRPYPRGIVGCTRTNVGPLRNPCISPILRWYLEVIIPKNPIQNPRTQAKYHGYTLLVVQPFMSMKIPFPTTQWLQKTAKVPLPSLPLEKTTLESTSREVNAAGWYDVQIKDWNDDQKHLTTI